MSTPRWPLTEEGVSCGSTLVRTLAVTCLKYYSNMAFSLSFLYYQIPARYIRIDDVNLADLDAANKRRMDEIEISKAMLRKLRKQKVILEQEHREARLARDECLEKQKQGELWELQTRKSTELQVHPLLQKAVAEKKKKVIVPEENKPLLVKRASDETKSISALLEQLPSAYS